MNAPIAEMESPFTPGMPADSRLFVGREEQIHQLLSAAEKAKRGDFQIAYVSGERGIGKSSLVKMALRVAEVRNNAVVVQANLGGISDFAGLGRMSLETAAQVGESRPWGENLLEALKQRVSVERIGVMGVNISLKGAERKWEEVGRNLPTEMAGLLGSIGQGRAPMILALDDINGIAQQPEFADWVKSAAEMAKMRGGRVPVFMILIGLEESRAQMRKNNESVPRVFQPTLFVEPWSPRETSQFFQQGFEKGGVLATNEDKQQAKQWLPLCVEYSGGFPMLAQEIGHAVWLRAKNRENGRKTGWMAAGIVDAANAIGRQHLQGGVVDALRSPVYKSVLAKAVARGDKFSRRDLRENAGLSEKEKTGLDAFLRRMRKLGAIVPDEESAEQGAYRFPTMLHSLYFRIAAAKDAGQDRRAK